MSHKTLFIHSLSEIEKHVIITEPNEYSLYVMITLRKIDCINNILPEEHMLQVLAQLALAHWEYLASVHVDLS